VAPAIGRGVPRAGVEDVAKGLDGVDVLFGDHTDQGVNVTVGNVVVTENRSKGRGYTKVVINVVNGAVTTKSVTQVDAQVLKTVSPPGSCDGGDCSCPATACGDTSFQCITTAGPTLGKCQKNLITPDPAAEAFLKPYRDQLAVKFDVKVSVNDQIYVRDGAAERTGEVPIGDLIADAMLDRYKAQGAQIAFTNGGGIRASLPSSYAPADVTLRRTAVGYAAGPPYDLVVGDVYTVLPFGNLCVVRKITGQVLWQVLEKSVEKLPATNGGFLQIAGFKFTYDAALAPGSRVVSVTLDAGNKDIPKTDTTEYTVVTGDFTNAGGDGYTMLIEPTPSAARDITADVLLGYLRAHNPLVLPTGNRIKGL
jgi:5'-nucleotidase